jgi:hypothetical protein
MRVPGWVGAIRDRVGGAGVAPRPCSQGRDSSGIGHRFVSSQETMPRPAIENRRLPLLANSFHHAQPALRRPLRRDLIPDRLQRNARRDSNASVRERGGEGAPLVLRARCAGRASASRRARLSPEGREHALGEFNRRERRRLQDAGPHPLGAQLLVTRRSLDGEKQGSRASLVERRLGHPEDACCASASSRRSSGRHWRTVARLSVQRGSLTLPGYPSRPGAGSSGARGAKPSSRRASSPTGRRIRSPRRRSSAVISLMRENGRFPTYADHKMIRTSDGTFPGPKVITKKLGGRDERIARVRAFITSRPDYADVLPLLPAESDGDRDVPERPSARAGAGEAIAGDGAMT